MPDEKIERLRSLLAHANEQEKVDPSPVEDSSRTSYAASADEIERLRSLFARAHDREKTNPFRRLFRRSPADSPFARSSSNSRERISTRPDAPKLTGPERPSFNCRCGHAISLTSGRRVKWRFFIK